MNTIHIVTLMEEYQMTNQWAYSNKEDANARYNGLVADQFNEAANSHNAKYPDEIVSLEEYQGSEDWWDSDYRVHIHIEEIEVV